MEKRVFVTVGTTRFDHLIETVLGIRGQRLQLSLAAKGYTHLIVQSGKSPVDSTDLSASRLIVDQYDYKRTIKEDITSDDLVISHAGAGTCLEVLEAGKPLIIVVNEQLMDNHQTELAEKLGSDGHVEYCVCTGA